MTTTNDFEYLERVMQTSIGDFRIQQKGKMLVKFGTTINADSGVETTIARFQGSVVNETLATGNTVDSVVSSSGSDSGSVTIEGHTVDGSGNMTFVVQAATLNGQTPVTLGTALFRCTRIYRTNGTYASPATPLVGNVYVYDATAATGVTSGVPDVATATKCMIVAGAQQSEKCATSVSSSDAWIITGIAAAIEKDTGGAAKCEIRLVYKHLSGVWRPASGLVLSLDTAAIQQDQVFEDPPAIIGPNSDVKLTVTSNAANVVVHGTIFGILAIAA